jgi:hypothetical protein
VARAMNQGWVGLAALCALLATAAGCNDNALQALHDGSVQRGDDAGAIDDDDSGSDDDDAVLDDPPPDRDDDDSIPEEPPPFLEACPDDAVPITGFEGDDGADEIYAISWGPTWMSATLTAPVAGRFAVYDSGVYESGPSQTNESSYLRIQNADNPEGLPEDPTCEGEHVVVDGDNDGPPPAPLVYLGTFWLVQGDNDLALHHYCPLFRSGRCEELHVGDPEADGGCDDDNWNSVHLVAEGICLVPRSP